jgi:hypothetical protein
MASDQLQTSKERVWILFSLFLVESNILSDPIEALKFCLEESLTYYELTPRSINNSGESAEYDFRII